MQFSVLRPKMLALAFAVAVGALSAFPAFAQVPTRNDHACIDFQYAATEQAGAKFLACVPSEGECRGICLFIPHAKCGFSSVTDNVTVTTNFIPNAAADTNHSCNIALQSPVIKPCFHPDGTFIACVESQDTCNTVCAKLPGSPACTVSADQVKQTQYCAVGGPNDPKTGMHACFDFSGGIKQFIVCQHSFDACTAACPAGFCGFSPLSVDNTAIGTSAIDTGADSSQKCNCTYLGKKCGTWNQSACSGQIGGQMTRQCSEDWTCGTKNVYTETAACGSTDACSGFQWKCSGFGTVCTTDDAGNSVLTQTCRFEKKTEPGSDYGAMGDICGGSPPESKPCPNAPTLNCSSDADLAWRCEPYPDCPATGGSVNRICLPNADCRPPLAPKPETTKICPNKTAAAGTNNAPVNAGSTSLPNPLGTADINQLLGTVIRLMLNISGSIALLMFVYGGYLWLTSAGEKDKVQKGKDIMKWAVIGLLLIFLAYAAVAQIFGFLSQIGTSAQ